MNTVQTPPQHKEKATNPMRKGGLKGVTSHFQTASPAGLDCNGSLGAGNPIHPRTTALIHGPTPPRLILNRWHDRELRMQVAKISRALPDAERLARSGDPSRISELVRLRTYQQAYEVGTVDGLFLHREANPATTEEARLWSCVIGNSDRLRRLKKAVELIRAEHVQHAANSPAPVESEIDEEIESYVESW